MTDSDFKMNLENQKEYKNQSRLATPVVRGLKSAEVDSDMVTEYGVAVIEDSG